jgi:CRISPR-associated endonuclease/helicase Cas3
MTEWGTAGYALLRASISQHGRPVSEPIGLAKRIWQPVPTTATCLGFDPARTLATIGEQARRVFPQAFERSGESLPGAPAIIHLFAGLVQLSDWLGSDTRFFPYSTPGEIRAQTAAIKARIAVQTIGLDVSDQRARLREQTLSFTAAFGLPYLRPVQRVIDEDKLEPLLILVLRFVNSATRETLI